MDADNEKDKILTQAFGFKEPMVGYAYGLVKNWQSAEDVVQEAFIVIGKKWQNYTPGTSIFSWVRSIVRFECLTMMRSIRKEIPTEEDRLESFLETKLDEIWNDSTANTLHAQIHSLRSCMEDLPDRSKRLLLDFYLHGNSYQRIADDINKSLSFVKDNLFRLRKKLRRCMESKSTNEHCDIFDSETKPEFFDDIYYGELSSNQRKSVVNELENNPDAGKWLQAFIIEHTALSIIATQMRYSGSMELMEPARAPSTINQISKDEKMARFETLKTSLQQETKHRKKTAYIWQGLAACLILGLGLTSWNSNSQEKTSFAKIDKVTGVVDIVRANLTTDVAVPNSFVYPGDVLITNSGSQIEVTMDEGRSRIILTEQTKFQIGTWGDNKNDTVFQFLLKDGVMEGIISRQDLKNPFVISTPYADVTVLGTRFKLSSHPRQTELSVIEGRVSFRNRKSNKARLVNTNEAYAILRNEDTINSLNANKYIAAHKTSAETPTYKGILAKTKTGLIRNFHFEKRLNDRIFDSSPSAQHGTLWRMSEKPSTAGLPGHGIKLSGSGGYIDLGNDKELELRDNFTIGFLVKLTDEQEACILAKESQRLDFAYKITVRPDTVAMTIRTENGNTFTASATDNFMQWKSVAFTLENNELKAYVGTKKPREPIALRSTKSIGNSRLISSANGKLQLGFNPQARGIIGAIDELMIYNRALNLTELKRFGINQITRLNVEFEEIDNSYVYDSSSFEFRAQIMGRVGTEKGINGQALSLTREGYIYFPQTKEITASMTFEFWMRGSSAENTGTVELLSKNDAYRLQIENQNKLTLLYKDRDPTTYKKIECPYDILDGQWHHVVVCYNTKSAHTLSVSIDERAWETPCEEFITNGKSGVSIGGSQDRKQFYGLIDQVRYYFLDYPTIKDYLNVLAQQ